MWLRRRDSVELGLALHRGSKSQVRTRGGDLKLGAFSGRFWVSNTSSSQFPANPFIAGPIAGRGAKPVQNYPPFVPPIEKEFSSYLSARVSLLSWGTRLALRTLRGDKGRAEGRKGESGAGAAPGTAAPVPCTAPRPRAASPHRL